MPALRLAPRRPPGGPDGVCAWRRWGRLLAFVMLALAGGSCSSLPAHVDRPVSQAFASPDRTRLGRLALTLRQQAGARSDSGFRLLESVEMAFGSRLALIEQAQHTLDLQYYAIHADPSTALLMQRLRAAAARGVRVRILLDDFNSVGEDAQVLRLAFEPGIDIRLFNPAPGPRGSLVTRILGSLHDLPRLQQRMHNKLFIADNAWGITGGRNLGDAYFGGSEGTRFVDLDVLAAGRIVRDMSNSFDRYWNDANAYPVQSLLTQGDLDRLRDRAAPQPPADGPPATVQLRPLDLAQARLAWAPAVLMVDRPGKIGPDESESADEEPETVVEGLLALMRQAREEVLVVSPYFVPGRQMMETFESLQARRVAVRVLTNSLASTDAPVAHAGYARHRPQLLGLGVQLYEMRAGPRAGGGLGSGVLSGQAGGSKGQASHASLHSKAVIIDRRLVVIGSMNLDLRSQLHNSEVALVIRSRALAQQAADAVAASFATSAYRVERSGDGLRWRAPPAAPFRDSDQEPDAPLHLRLLLRLVGPLAPDEML